MKKRNIFGLALFTMILGVTSCSKDNNEIETNPLEKTTWSYEQSDFSSKEEIKRWGTLRFQTNTNVIKTDGYEIQGEDSNGGDYHASHQRKETTESGTYHYNAPNLTITLRAKDGKQAPTFKYIVDENSQTIRLVTENTNSPKEIVYKKK